MGAITLVGKGGGFIHKQREVAVSPIQGPVSFCKPTGQRGFDKNKTNKAFIGLHKNISRCSNQMLFFEGFINRNTLRIEALRSS